jgi:hypothetical protein
MGLGFLVSKYRERRFVLVMHLIGEEFSGRLKSCRRLSERLSQGKGYSEVDFDGGREKAEVRRCVG